MAHPHSQRGCQPPKACRERLYRLLCARRLAELRTSTTSTSTTALGASTIVHFVSPSASSERAAIAGALRRDVLPDPMPCACDEQDFAIVRLEGV